MFNFGFIKKKVVTVELYETELIFLILFSVNPLKPYVIKTVQFQTSDKRTNASSHKLKC